MRAKKSKANEHTLCHQKKKKKNFARGPKMLGAAKILFYYCCALCFFTSCVFCVWCLMCICGCVRTPLRRRCALLFAFIRTLFPKFPDCLHSASVYFALHFELEIVRSFRLTFLKNHQSGEYNKKIKELKWLQQKLTGCGDNNISLRYFKTAFLIAAVIRRFPHSIHDTHTNA